ncbi:glycoside hydrolase family 88 protein [Paenibacillus hodogayensis]|uniref:Glycoside hydrolase family 88 protein n=1 Tax=Paenibacillus hodogayensis TaxID=279208 RepID=A0ABV5W1I1_9BACL
MKQTDTIVYETARVLAAPDLPLPEHKRVPAGWSAVPIGQTGHELKLAWSGLPLRPLLAAPQRNARLRINVAVEMREVLFVEAYLLESGERLGTFDIRYAYVFQPFELPLLPQQAEAALRQGVGLRILETEATLWVFDGLQGDGERSLFAPHLMIAEEGPPRPMEQFLNRMLSLDSLQPFGWLEGCVLDGLYALRQATDAIRVEQAIVSHLSQYVTEDGQLRYEDLYGAPSDGRFSGIESTLPVAVIAKRQPDHPLVKQLVAYWDDQLVADKGVLSAESTITAEGAYTMAYPMAVLASQLPSKPLAQLAIRQLLLRRHMLIDGRHLYGLVSNGGHRRIMRNWARSYTWYMLGFVRTWIELQRSPYAAELAGMEELTAEFRRIADVVVSLREPEGLWACFLGEPETGIETSGSAGIAAALALGARHGLLAPASLDVARHALQALETYVTPDGLLHGVSQHNCGGLVLQRGGYRVLSQMGMGLLAQLYAAIHTEPASS